MQLTKEQQLFALNTHAGTLYQQMLREIKDHEGYITALAHQRLEMGFEMYGSLMWDWDIEQLRRNRFEEYADGLVYLLPEIPV